MYGEVGKYPVIHRVHVRMISFWIKISEGKSTKLSSIIYRLIYKLHLDSSYDSPWLISIKDILYNSGNSRYWLDQEMLSPKSFMKHELSLHFQARFLQDWDAEIVRNRRCVAYSIFKDNSIFQTKNDFVFQPYLSYLSFLDRRALAKFRSGSHTLPVTKSRYREGGGGVDVKCNFCNDLLCDEFHVLFICKFFEEPRKKYLKKILYC